MANRPIRVLPAADRAAVHGGFRLIPESQPGLEVIGVACRGHEAVTQAIAVELDLVILGVSMPALHRMGGWG
jgi:DNA-binding NarL/FixJ family response regulator